MKSLTLTQLKERKTMIKNLLKKTSDDDPAYKQTRSRLYKITNLVYYRSLSKEKLLKFATA